MFLDPLRPSALNYTEVGFKIDDYLAYFNMVEVVNRDCSYLFVAVCSLL